MFIADLSSLYGRQSMVYNVHLLHHLPEFVGKYGPLDQFSAFQFESFLGRMKKRLRLTSKMFAHCVNQLSSFAFVRNLPVQPDLFYGPNFPNNFCLLSDGTVVMINSIDGKSVCGVKLQFVKSSKLLLKLIIFASLLLKME